MHRLDRINALKQANLFDFRSLTRNWNLSSRSQECEFFPSEGDAEKAQGISLGDFAIARAEGKHKMLDWRVRSVWDSLSESLVPRGGADRSLKNEVMIWLLLLVFLVRS